MRFLKTNRRAFCALTLTTLVASGQAAEKPAQTVLLSEFTVKENSDIGYIASESVTGTRVATQIKDLPFSVSVITSEFMNDFDWSIKKLLKEMVMSATYRQNSKTNEELQKIDPLNKVYARGPRIRLSAEQLRDQALAVSNSLSGKMYGKSVMPFQPEGIWRSPYNGDKWVMSQGEDQNRRALYTYWKRTAPYPTMITFDGGAREVCVTRRIRTNTPLQALTSLNDSTYFVMARNFAFKMQELDTKDVNNQIRKGYEHMMFKPITETKLNALLELYTKSLGTFTKNEKATIDIIGEKDTQPKPETAALVVVASAMLNLDEWVNKN